ncbi:MAG TPA: DUF1992 domain-containing protein [bacterium]|nr:DUF1992 domain-containing protein [bacterium]
MVEQKIQEAIDRGDLDNLPMKGKPLLFHSDPRMPREIRGAYKVLKNAGMLPEEMQLRKEIHSIKALLQACDIVQEKRQLARRLNDKQLRYELLMERHRNRAYPRYRSKIMKRFR